MCVSKKNIKTYIYFLILLLGLIRICLFSNSTYKAYSCLLLGGLYLVSIRKNIGTKRRIWILLLGIIVGVSVFSYNSGISGMFLALTYFFQYTTPFLLCIYLKRKYGYKKMITGALYATISITFLMDFSVFSGIEIDPTHYQNLTLYLFGNKFMVAYLHMQLLGLYAEHMLLKHVNLSIRDKLKIIFIGVYSIWMCTVVSCSTGVVGNMIILLMVVCPFSENIKKRISNPFFVFGIILILNISIIGSDVLVNLPLFRFIVEDILNRNITLTGRYTIYQMLPDLISKKLWFGYGYNRDIFSSLIGYGNAQNGILQYVIDCGMVGCIIFMINWFNSIKTCKTSFKEIWPLICTMYGFIVCGLVEVCFKTNFILIIALIFSSNVNFNYENT